MKQRNKIIIGVLLNLIIFGGVGYLIHYLAGKANPSTRGTFVVTEFRESNPDIVSSVDFGGALQGHSSRGGGSTPSGLPSTGVATPSSTSPSLIGGSSVGGGATLSLTSGGGSASSSYKDDTPSSSGGGISLLAYGGGSGSRSATLNTGAGASLSTPVASASMAVPFQNNSMNGVILVDPGTDPNEDERIPVGNGIWILLLLGGIYGTIRVWS